MIAWFRNRLAIKLMVLLLVGITCINLLMLSSATKQAEETALAAFNEERIALTRQLRLILAEPVFVYDTEALQSIVDSFLPNTMLQKIAVFDQRDEPMAYVEAEDRNPYETSSVPLEWDGRDIGRIDITVSDAPIVEATGQAMKGRLTALLITNILTLLLTYAGVRILITRPLRALSYGLVAIAEGGADLGHRLRVGTKDEIGRLAHAFNQSLDTWGQIVASIRQSTGELNGAVRQVTRGNENLSDRTSHQAASLEEISATMEQITQITRESAESARSARTQAAAGKRRAEEGGMKVDESLAAMKEIRSAMAELSRLVEVIDDVAYQTKLLALNASIEAAQAGNAGRGFAVVAVSIRQLSEQAIQAADEARKLFDAGTKRVDRGMDLSSETGEAFGEIIESVRRLADTFAQFAESGVDQSSRISEVNAALQRLEKNTQTNAALVEEVAAASVEMDSQAERLRQMVAGFELTSSANG